MNTFIVQWNEGIRTKTIPRLYWHLLLLFFKISIPTYAFLPSSQNIKRCPWGTKPIPDPRNQLPHGFLNCLVSLVVMTSQVIFQGPEQVVVWRVQIRTVGWWENCLPAVSLNYPQGQTCSARPRVVVLKDDSLLLRTFFTKRTTKLAERLDIASCIDRFPFQKKKKKVSRHCKRQFP